MDWLHLHDMHCPWGGLGASQVSQWVKNPPAMQETRVQSLGWDDPLEKEGMATPSGILAWRIPWMEEPGRLQSTGSQRLRHDCRNGAHMCGGWTEARGLQTAGSPPGRASLVPPVF